MAVTDLDYAKVVGRFALTVGDTADPDDDPDIIWCDEGKVTFQPLQTFTKVAGGADGPFTAGNAVIEATVGADGRLTYLGKTYVHVIDLTSPKVNPQIGANKATHKVRFIGVKANGTPVDFPDVDVRLTKDGPDGDGVNDLTELIPVVPGASTPIYRGEKGVGIAGLAIVDTDKLQVELTDGTTLEAGPLPAGPGGSDPGVAAYLADDESESRAALDQANADLLDDPASTFRAGVTASTAQAAASVDKAVLARLATVGDGDRAASVANSQLVHTDSVGWTEEFVDLTKWFHDGLQVVNGRVYNNSGGSGSKSGRRVLTGINSDPYRETGTLDIVAGATNAAMLFGVTSSTSPSASGGALYALGVDSAGKVRVYDRGSWQNPELLAGLGLDDVLPAGRYYWTIAASAIEISMSLYNADQTIYARKGIARSDLGMFLTSMGLFAGDNRDAAGSSFGGLVARAGRASLSGNPRGSLEGASAHVERYAVVGASTREATFYIPKGYDSRKPSPIIIYCHGQGDTEDHILPATRPTAVGPVIKALVDAGYLVVASDFAGPINWGYPAAVAAFEDLYRHLRDKWPLAPIGVLANSMGSTVSLNTIARRKVPGITCWYGIQPACNLAAAYAGAFTSVIKTAYGIAADGSDYAAKTAGYDPMTREGWEFRGLPMRVVASPADTAVPKAQHADVLVAKVQPYAQAISMLVVSGGHSDPSHFVPSDALAFFNEWMPAPIPPSATLPPVPLPPVTITDNYNRADSTTSAGPQGTALSGVFGVKSNAAYLVSGSSSQPWSVLAYETGRADGVAQVEVTGVSAATALSNLGLAFRILDANNYFGARLTSTGALQVWKVVNGVGTQTFSGPATYTNPGTSTIADEMVGNGIVIKVNGVAVHTFNDAFNVTTTKHGLWGVGVNANVTADNFSFVG